MADFDSHFDDVLCGRKVTEDGFAMSLQRHTADPASWSGMGMLMAKHVDDGIVIGTGRT